MILLFSANHIRQWNTNIIFLRDHWQRKIMTTSFSCSIGVLVIFDFLYHCFNKKNVCKLNISICSKRKKNHNLIILIFNIGHNKTLLRSFL